MKSQVEINQEVATLIEKARKEAIVMGSKGFEESYVVGVLQSELETAKFLIENTKNQIEVLMGTIRRLNDTITAFENR